MKKIRRLITDPITKQIKMMTLYEYSAKVGTHGSTIVWLLERAEKGKRVYGFCMENRCTPYMKGQAFRYAETEYFCITDIQNRVEGKFLFVSR